MRAKEYKAARMGRRRRSIRRRMWRVSFGVGAVSFEGTDSRVEGSDGGEDGCVSSGCFSEEGGLGVLSR